MDAGGQDRSRCLSFLQKRFAPASRGAQTGVLPSGDPPGRSPGLSEPLLQPSPPHSLWGFPLKGPGSQATSPMCGDPGSVGNAATRPAAVDLPGSRVLGAAHFRSLWSPIHTPCASSGVPLVQGSASRRWLPMANRGPGKGKLNIPEINDSFVSFQRRTMLSSGMTPHACLRHPTWDMRRPCDQHRPSVTLEPKEKLVRAFLETRGGGPRTPGPSQAQEIMGSVPAMALGVSSGTVEPDTAG